MNIQEPFWIEVQYKVDENSPIKFTVVKGRNKKEAKAAVKEQFGNVKIVKVNCD